MSAAAFLAARELRARWRRVVLAGAAVAALVAAATAIELLARAREDAVAGRLDAMGPALTVVPAGTTAGALARGELGGRVLPPGARAEVEAALGRDLRRADAVLVLQRVIAGAPTVVLGVERGEGSAAGGALLGAELARRLGARSAIVIDGAEVPVAGVRSPTGELEDVAVTLPRARAGALAGDPAAVNALHLALRAGVDPAEAARRLAAAPGLSVVRHDRGEVATAELPASLARHRALAHGLFALAAALCLLIVSALDAAERRVEIATLVAIGAPRRAVIGALVGRSVAVAAAGALLGAGAGLALAALQDASAAGALLRHPGALALPVLAACGLAALAAAPTALAAALRDPVPALQEI